MERDDFGCNPSAALFQTRVDSCLAHLTHVQCRQTLVQIFAEANPRDQNPETMMPSPGLITHYHRPGGIGVRVDDFIYTGYNVSPHYDSMISKVIVKADSRTECIARSLRALGETVVGGISTNIELHKRILKDDNFRENTFNTNFLAEKML